MKKLSTIIMALALVLGMSQCKKEETPTNGNGGEKVYVTLNVNNGESIAVNVDNGSRHEVAPTLGVIQFRDGDILHVGYNGQYIGQLTYQNGAFGGELNGPTDNVQDHLHFYFLGGKGINENSPAVGATSFDFSIADQSAKLPVLCYGASNQIYGASSNYTAVLEYKCALVRFDLENHGEDYSVTLNNVPTQATVNFANPTATTAIVATANQTNANMTLYGEPGNAAYRWAILLPETNLNNGHDDLSWEGEGETIPVMGNNTYINGGISISNPLPLTLPNADLVIKNGNDFSEFTVSSTGKKVYFSKANLTWNENDGYHFHATQFDEEHSGGTNLIYPFPATGDVTLSGLTGLDRFTWGHIPNQSINSSYYITNQQLADGLDPEWGKQMTGEGNDHWRTLTADEWNYLLHQRPGNRFMLVSVLVPITYNNEPYYTNVQGLLLFPDNFDYTGLGLTQAAGVTSGIGFWPGRINKVYGNDDYQPASGNYTVTYDSYMDAYTTNFVAGPYKLIEPANNLEHLYTNSSSNMYKLLQAGCVFLPAVGCREGATYKKYHYYDNRKHAAQGFYWTSDRVTVGSQETANYFWFGYVGGSNVETNPRPTFEANNTQHRSLGCCVRLVWDAN